MAKRAPVTCALLLGCLTACDPAAWERAELSVHERELSAALERYRADFGGYPGALDDLVPDYLTALPAPVDALPAYLYDADSGTVRVVALIDKGELAAMKAVDESNLARIDAALAAFRSEHGGHPISLDELAPAYIASIPAGAGAFSDYYYSAGTGTVQLDPDLQRVYDAIAAEPIDADRDVYDEEVDNLDAIIELSDGQGYPDPREVLSTGSDVFEQRRAVIGEESGGGPLDVSEPPPFAADALERYEQRDPSTMPTPGEVLSAGKTVFREVYGTESDPELTRKSEDIYHEHVNEDGTLDETKTPSAEEVLEAGREIFNTYLNADESP